MPHIIRSNSGKQTQFETKLGNKIIPNVDCSKCLGLWFDKNMTWKEHSTKLVLKLKSKFGLLQQSKNLLTVESRRQVYYAQIHSNLVYGLVIWGNMLEKTHLDKLKNCKTNASKLSTHDNLQT